MAYRCNSARHGHVCDPSKCAVRSPLFWECGRTPGQTGCTSGLVPQRGRLLSGLAPFQGSRTRRGQPVVRQKKTTESPGDAKKILCKKINLRLCLPRIAEFSNNPQSRSPHHVSTSDDAEQRWLLPHPRAHRTAWNPMCTAQLLRCLLSFNLSWRRQWTCTTRCVTCASVRCGAASIVCVGLVHALMRDHAHASQLAHQVLNLSMIVCSALMIWKSLMGTPLCPVP